MEKELENIKGRLRKALFELLELEAFLTKDHKDVWDKWVEKREEIFSRKKGGR